MKKNNLLKIGDIIELEKGMIVYAEIPGKFVFSNGGFDETLYSMEVKIGKKYSNSVNYAKTYAGLIENVYSTLRPKGILVKRHDVHEFLKKYVPKNKFDEFILSPGKFIVIDTHLGGGSQGRDPYPDGHNVKCQRMRNDELDSKGDIVSFYQTGCFTAMIENIKPIKSVKLVKQLYIAK